MLPSCLGGVTMKKFIILLLVFSIALCFVGCGGGETAEQAVQNAFNAIKVADVEAASKYIDYNKILDASSEDVLSVEDDKKPEEATKAIFKNIEYKILESTEKEKAAIVKAEITNIDMRNVTTNFFSQMFALAFSGLDEKELEEKSFEIYMDLINQENKTVTKTVEINLSKENGGWKIVQNTELADALSGGLTTFDMLGDEEDSDVDKLNEIDRWLISDIWNNGFVDIKWYIENGTSSTGETLDIDFTLESLDMAMKKKPNYDSFIDGLEEEQYIQIKSIWERLSPEIDMLYNQAKETSPSNSLDTGKFRQYSDAFSDAIDDLD